MNDLSHPIILAIDPDPISLAAIRTALDCQGYKVHTAQNSDAALKLADYLALDLIITELAIDDKGGVELLKEIRHLDSCSDVPVMFMSRNQAPNVIRRTHEFGAAYHLRKPFDPSVLLELAQRALWMPHLVHNHLNQVNRPHMPILPANQPTIPMPNSSV